MTQQDDRGEVGPHGAVAVAVLGTVLAVGFTWNFLRELGELDVVAPPVAVFAMGLGMSTTLAYAGARWMRGAYTLAETRRVAAWSYAGSLAVVLVVGFTIVIRVAEGRTLAEPELEVLVGAAGGAVAGLVAGHQNVLAHRRVGEAERARDSMAFLNRTLRHEVLNGVQLVSGHARNLREYVDDDAEPSVETIEETSEDLTDLIEDVRQVADVHAGTADLRAVDLADVVPAEAERIETAHADAVLEVDLPDDATVRANDAIEHVFRNLLENAVEHHDGDPTVRVTADVGPEVISVEVADDGPGIPDERKPDLFDPAEGSTHGFGLHLVQTLVEGYGGEVTVGDNEPTGTVFVVDLPRPDTPTGGVFDGGRALGRPDEPEETIADGGSDGSTGTDDDEAGDGRMPDGASHEGTDDGLHDETALRGTTPE